MFPTSVRQTKSFSGGRLFWRFQVFIVHTSNALLRFDRTVEKKEVFSASFKKEICMVLNFY